MTTPTVQMTRRVVFSSGHRYWWPDLTADENKLLFGPWASPYNHGHNYALEVTVVGRVDPRTGMVVNIKRVDDVLRDRITGLCDGKSLNDEVEAFKSTPPSVENILLFCRSQLLATLPSECSLTEIKLEETPTLYGELHETDQNPIMTLTRIYEFCASHRLHSEALTPQENIELFGKCNNPAGHGHNYVLEVTVQGEPNPQTGMMADLDSLDTVVNEEVVDRYDHKNLNVDIPEFQTKPASSEYIAAEIFSRLDGKVPAKLHRVRLFETARNIFTVTSGN